jgi:hypothetical protein
MAVHSWWSCSCEDDDDEDDDDVVVSSGESSDRCSEVKARCRISRHGLVHCVVSAWKTGSQ